MDASILIMIVVIIIVVIIGSCMRDNCCIINGIDNRRMTNQSEIIV